MLDRIGEKLKTKSLLFFVSFFSCDLQDFKGGFRAQPIVAPILCFYSYSLQNLATYLFFFIFFNCAKLDNIDIT